jgi:hypothetical protein
MSPHESNRQQVIDATQRRPRHANRHSRSRVAEEKRFIQSLQSSFSSDVENSLRATSPVSDEVGSSLRRAVAVLAGATLGALLVVAGLQRVRRLLGLVSDRDRSGAASQVDPRVLVGRRAVLAREFGWHLQPSLDRGQIGVGCERARQGRRKIFRDARLTEWSSITSRALRAGAGRQPRSGAQAGYEDGRSQAGQIHPRASHRSGASEEDRVWEPRACPTKATRGHRQMAQAQRAERTSLTSSVLRGGSTGWRGADPRASCPREGRRCRTHTGVATDGLMPNVCGGRMRACSAGGAPAALRPRLGRRSSP